jgi:hypothetical protein
MDLRYRAGFLYAKYTAIYDEDMKFNQHGAGLLREDPRLLR